jgi:predicted anti-sigma-YlaC factor YlaD
VNCSRTVDLANDHVDGVLPPSMAQIFYQHLAGCVGCRSYVTELSSTVALLALIEPEPPAPEVRTRLSELFAEWARDR